MKILKRIACYLLSIILILNWTMVVLQVNATTKTQSQAVTWINEKIGLYLDYDGAYGAQCVDLIKYYYDFLGDGSTSGNGSDYAWNALPSGWQRIQYYSGFVAQPGDVAVWTWTSAGGEYGHVALVTSATSTNMTVVDQNGSGHVSCGYSTYSYGSSSMTFYGVVRPSFSSQSQYNYTSISEGNYYIQNAKTGGFIIYENAVDANEQNVILTPFSHHNAQKMYITSASTGYKIQPNGTARLLNPFGSNVVNGLNVNIYNNSNDSSQWWRFQKVDGGYVIHNVQNENCVLDATEYGNVVVSTYQEGNQSQIWKIEKTSILPEVPTYTYSVKNQKIVVNFTNYKSTEVHEVVVYDASEKRVYAAYNVEGQSHTTTKLAPGTYSLRVVAVSKYIGAYQVGANSTVLVEPSREYATLSEGNYYIQNAKTGGFIIYENAVDANNQNVVLTPFGNHNAQKMYITRTTDGYKIQPNGTARVLNPNGTDVVNDTNVTIYDNKDDSSQWWQFQKVDDGYIIYNAKNEDCVLAATEYGNVVVSNYQKDDQSQIWKIEKTSVLPDAPTYTYSVENQKIVVNFTNYKSSEVHEVVVYTDSGEKVYTAYNIEGQQHTTTAFAPGTYSLRVVAVSKYIGAYQVGVNSNVEIFVSCNHTPGSIIVDRAATCGVAGLGHKECTKCGTVVQSGITIAATGNHSWNAGVVTKQPTATSTGVKTYTCTVCSATKNETIPAISVSAVRKFTDVQKKDWYYKAVEYVVNNNLFSGLTETDFGPGENMTRGMFVTVLGRLHGVSVSKKVSTKFVDVKKNQYYTGYVKWANDNNIVSGLTTTTFGPEENINREQICAMMVRYCSYAKITLQKKNAAITFKDGAKISKFARSAVKACQQGGIVNGEKVSGGYNFRPQGNATRAEVATIMMNFAKAYK